MDIEIPSRMGRKNIYFEVEKKFTDIIAWRQEGKTEEEIANLLNIAYSTLKLYKRKHPEFAELLRESKQRLANKIKKSLYKEAMGYEYEEVTEVFEGIIDVNGNEKSTKKIKRTKTKKMMRGVPQLIIFALCNLCPEQFQRVDKEIIDEIEKKIDEKLKHDNSLFKEAFDKLYKDGENKENDSK